MGGFTRSRLFVTEDAVCTHSNIFGKELQHVFPWCEVKEAVASMDRIEIYLEDGRVVHFTGFANPARTIDLFKRKVHI